MNDRYYPSYHFRPEKNWMNDPNGLIWREGMYHMFYQYNPFGDRWGTIHWGHAVSKDLIHWKELPIALYPSQEEGEIHCYSGCAVEKEGIPYLFYTSVGEGEREPEYGAQQWSAVSNDGMKTFRKLGKPAIPQSLHEGEKMSMWRDPFLWKEEEGWFAVLGGSSKGKGCLWLYRSRDLVHWEYLNRMFETEAYWLTECPNMIPFEGGTYLLLYSPLDAVRYCVGKLDRKNWSFQAERTGIFDHSIEKKGFYAPNTYLTDPKERKIVIGWISEADGLELKDRTGWAGMQSLPREVWLTDTGEVRVSPAKECEMLRKKRLLSWEDVKEAGKMECRSGSAEIVLSLEKGWSGAFEIWFFDSGDGQEFTRLFYAQDGRGLVLDRLHSTLYEEPGKQELACPIEEGEEQEIRIYLDRSVAEIFVGQKETITARIYPKLQESDRIRFSFSNGRSLRNLEVWELAL